MEDLLDAVDHLRNRLGVFYWTLQHGGDREGAAEQLCDAIAFAARAKQPADTLYVVKEGEVDIIVNDKVVETVGSGGIVGEMALIDARARSATVVTKTDCQLVPINEKRFTFLIQQTPYFSLHVMRVLVERLRKMDARV